jgi:hypothetical protein
MGKKKKEEDLVYMTPDQIREMRADIDSLDRMLKVDESGVYGRPKIQDKVEFQEELNKKKKTLRAHTPKKVTGVEANKLFARSKELKQKIQDAMVPTKDFYQSYPKGGGSSFDFERAVRQQMAFQRDPKMQQDIAEYKQIVRRLDPDDPMNSNIEHFRP